MVDFSNLYIMFVKHQPMEAYFAYFTLVNTGTCAQPCRWKDLCPRHLFHFSGEYGGIDLVSSSPYIVRAHNLIYPCTCHGLLQMHDVCPKFADQAKLQCMYEILTPPCTYGIPLTGLLA